MKKEVLFLSTTPLSIGFALSTKEFLGQGAQGSSLDKIFYFMLDGVFSLNFSLSSLLLSLFHLILRN